MRQAVRTAAMGVAALAALWVGGQSLGAEIVSALAVSEAQAGWAVSFKIDRPRDVTVRLTDREGEVVRHLAAGMVAQVPQLSP